MDQAELLRRVIGLLEDLGLTYMVVGSVASAAYGEPRLTRDIDIVISLPPERVGALCRAFSSPEYYLSGDAAAEAVGRGGQFNVIHPASGNKIDFIMARNDAYGRMQLRRRQRVRVLPDLAGYTAGPEDIILGKLGSYSEGGSEKHLRDVAGMMKVSGGLVDTAYVARWAEHLGLCQIWQAILDRLGDEA